MLASSITFTAIFPTIYYLDDYVKGQAKEPTRAQFLEFLRLRVAVSVLFWVCVWSVKFAFLFLYRMIFVVSTRFNRWWWCIVAFTVVMFWVVIAGEFTTCGPAKNLLNEGEQTKTQPLHRVVTHHQQMNANQRKASRNTKSPTSTAPLSTSYQTSSVRTPVPFTPGWAPHKTLTHSLMMS